MRDRNELIESLRRTPEESAEFVYGLIRDFRMLSNEKLEALESALGVDNPDVDLHQRGCAIMASLRAMRNAATAIFYLLPGEDW